MEKCILNYADDEVEALQDLYVQSGRLYNEGDDYKSAKRCLKEALDLGSSTAAYHLGKMSTSEDEQLNYFEKAKEMGSCKGSFEYFILTKGTMKDYRCPILCAADKGDRRGLAFAGALLIDESRAGTPSFEEGLHYLEQVKDSPIPLVFYHMALAHYKMQNYSAAYDWIQRFKDKDAATTLEAKILLHIDGQEDEGLLKLHISSCIGGNHEARIAYARYHFDNNIGRKPTETFLFETWLNELRDTYVEANAVCYLHDILSSGDAHPQQTTEHLAATCESDPKVFAKLSKEQKHSVAPLLEEDTLYDIVFDMVSRRRHDCPDFDTTTMYHEALELLNDDCQHGPSLTFKAQIYLALTFNRKAESTAKKAIDMDEDDANYVLGYINECHGDLDSAMELYDECTPALQYIGETRIYIRIHGLNDHRINAERCHRLRELLHDDDDAVQPSMVAAEIHFLLYLLSPSEPTKKHHLHQSARFGHLRAQLQEADNAGRFLAMCDMYRQRPSIAFGHDAVLLGVYRAALRCGGAGRKTLVHVLREAERVGYARPLRECARDTMATAPQEAQMYLQKACDLNDATACFMMGTLLHAGMHGVERNAQQAHALYIRAAALTDAQAMSMLTYGLVRDGPTAEQRRQLETLRDRKARYAWALLALIDRRQGDGSRDFDVVQQVWDHYLSHMVVHKEKERRQKEAEGVLMCKFCVHTAEFYCPDGGHLACTHHATDAAAPDDAAVKDNANVKLYYEVGQECSVCLDRLVDSVYRCGHLVCHACAQNLNTCPMRCDEPLVFVASS